MNDWLRQWRKDVIDQKNGKIHGYGSVGWVLGSTDYVNPQGVVFRARKDSIGRDMTLARCKPVTNCPCPPSGHDSAPIFAGGRYAVKESICKKCPHRLPKRCCALLKDPDAGMKALLQISDAVSRASEIVKKVTP